VAAVGVHGPEALGNRGGAVHLIGIADQRVDLQYAHVHAFRLQGLGEATGQVDQRCFAQAQRGVGWVGMLGQPAAGYQR
jgi:hypothetical protein